MIFKIFVKPPQSGKTRDAIIEPIRKSIENGRVPIVIIPPRIQLQKQLTSRINSELGIFSIGGFDTGQIYKLTPDQAIKIKRKLFIILNNKNGINKMLYMMIKTDKQYDIIIDEVHNFFDRKSSDAKFDILDLPFREMNFENNIAILFHLIKTKNYTISGTTATVSLICQSKLLEIFDIKPEIINLPTPSCYVGYNNIKHKFYKKNMTKVFNKIIKRSSETVTMCHVGKKMENHFLAAEKWIEICKANHVPNNHILAITDNCIGYTILNHDLEKKIYNKKFTTEPWKLINAFKDFGYKYIGIFGHACMSESNTYQKCNEDINCPINNLIILPFYHNIDKMTTIIQRMGRIFGNDTIGNKRTIWFPEGYKEKIDKGLELENFITEKKYLVDYEYAKNRVFSKETENSEILEKHIKKWLDQSNQTLVARFIRLLSINEEYKLNDMIEILKSLNAEHPKTIISHLQRDLSKTSNGYGKILEHMENGKYRIKKDLTKYFNQI